FAGFRIGRVRAGSVATHFIIGSLEGGDLEAWRFDDRAREPSSLQRALPSPSHIAGRYVSLDDEEVSVSMQTVPEQRLAPMSATAIDDDFDEAGGITVRRWDGSRLDSLPMHIHAGRILTYVAFHGLPRRWSTEHLPLRSEDVSPDSTVLRVYYASNDPRRIWIEAADRTLSFDAGPLPAALRLRAGSTRITVMRPDGLDTPRVSFAVPLQGGAAVTVFVTERGDSVAAHLLVDTDPRAQIPMPSLRVVPTVTPPVHPPIDSTGHILLVNAARGDDELVHTRYYVPTRVKPGETGRRDYGYPPGPNNGSIAVARPGDTVQRVLSSNVAVARDTTSILVTVGFEPSSPWRLLALNTPITRSEGDTAPRLRIVGAIDDLPAIDVVAQPGPRAGIEQRIIRDDWTASLPARGGPIRIDVLTPAGEPVFSAHDTLLAGHRYTAILTGVRRYPIAFLLDDEAGNGPLRRAVISLPPPPAGVDATVRDDAPRVSPNPASGTIVIRNAVGSNTISLVDDLGRVVLRETLRGDVHAVDVSGIPSGGYTIVSSGVEGVVWTERVVVR
ncbi:MAG TPA: hypothetical protein VNA88_00170, partial [Candidatus Kapabacteria bacterium]|nr:hypothetical protein [Candidatus Kapabacteria bacterium]